MVAHMKLMIRSFFREVLSVKFKHLAHAFLLAIFFALVFDYVRLHQEFSQFKQKYEESVVLSEKIKDVKLSLSNVDRMLHRLNGFTSKLKVIAQVPQKVLGSKVARHLEKERDISVFQPAKRGDGDIKYKELEEKIDLESLQLKLEELLSEAKKEEEFVSELEDLYAEHPTLLASIPSVKPSNGRVTSAFGFRKNPNGSWQMHEGIDFAAQYGTNIISPADGLVEKVSYSPGYGRYVIVDHGYGLKSTFAHTSKVLVKSGQYVERGKEIALVGNTGRTRGVHLHYEVKLNGVPVDPTDYMLN